MQETVLRSSLFSLIFLLCPDGQKKQFASIYFFWMQFVLIQVKKTKEIYHQVPDPYIKSFPRSHTIKKHPRISIICVELKKSNGSIRLVKKTTLLCIYTHTHTFCPSTLTFLPVDYISYLFQTKLVFSFILIFFLSFGVFTLGSFLGLFSKADSSNLLPGGHMPGPQCVSRPLGKECLRCGMVLSAQYVTQCVNHQLIDIQSQKILCCEELSCTLQDVEQHPCLYPLGASRTQHPPVMTTRYVCKHYYIGKIALI